MGRNHEGHDRHEEHDSPNREFVIFVPVVRFVVIGCECGYFFVAVNAPPLPPVTVPRIVLPSTRPV